MNQGVAEELHGSISPLICSTDGVLHHEYVANQKQLTSQLSTKWEKPYSIVMGWMKRRTQFTIFNLVYLWLQGFR